MNFSIKGDGKRQAQRQLSASNSVIQGFAADFLKADIVPVEVGPAGYGTTRPSIGPNCITLPAPFRTFLLNHVADLRRLSASLASEVMARPSFPLSGRQDYLKAYLRPSLIRNFALLGTLICIRLSLRPSIHSGSVFFGRTRGTTARMSKTIAVDNTAVASNPSPAMMPIPAVAQMLAAVVSPSI